MRQEIRRSRFRRGLAAGIFGAAFAPTDITGLQLWLDANDGSTLWQESTFTTPAGNGDVVGGWQDKGGQGNNATQTTTAAKPTRQNGIVNGLPVVRGDSDDEMVFSGIGPLTNETIFLVSIHNAPTSNGNILSGTGTNFRILYSSVVGRISYIYNSQGLDLSAGFTEDNPNIFKFMYDGADQSISVNNGTPVSAAIASGSHSFTDLMSAGSGIVPMDGDIAELLIYDSALSIADTSLVQEYLSAKWGITLS